MPKKVSVILPVYNVEKYLRTCLDSLLSQTLRDIEIICVNDGSTDGSPGILREYAGRDRRIRILDQDNQTPGAARNNGLKLARGTYIMFLDSDDFFAPEMLEEMAGRADETEADIVLCAYRRFDSGKEEHVSGALGLDADLLRDRPVFCRVDIPDRIISVTAPNVWTKLFRKSFLKRKKLTFPVMGNSEDVCFTYLALCLAGRIAWLPDAFVSYRVGREGSLESRKGDYPLCFIEADRSLYNELRRYGIFEEVERGYVNRTIRGILYGLGCLDRPSDLALVRQVLDRDFYPYTGLLDHPEDYYDRPDQVEILRKLRRQAERERALYDRTHGEWEAENE